VKSNKHILPAAIKDKFEFFKMTFIFAFYSVPVNGNLQFSLILLLPLPRKFIDIVSDDITLCHQLRVLVIAF